jgi:threonine/homoserine/homoserine lactone efflux protein
VPAAPPSPPASSEAITAVVFAIGAWLCFPLGIVAVVLGARARRLARENPGRVGGEQMALAAMLIGGAFVAMNTLIVLGYVLLFATFGFMHRMPP